MLALEIHFKPALRRPADYERLMATMKSGFLAQGRAGIVLARAVDDQLLRDTWEVPGYDRLPSLGGLDVPTLVLTGDHDFIPASVARNIASAIPRATVVTIPDCGHFAYLECADQVREALEVFFQG